MNIRFNGTLHSNDNIVQKILDFNGLSTQWLEAGTNDLLDGSLMRNFEKGKQLLEKHKFNRVVILVDNDADGLTSFATLYQWLKITYPNMELSYVIGEGKVHGIIEEILPPVEDYDLLIIPDASSSEKDKHEALAKESIDILILDHHEISELENDFAVIINPHHPDCPYPNKNLSGVGVVYKFIEAIDKQQNIDNHTQFLDLVATGLVADVMQMSLENKALINLGLKNIVNPYISAYLKADGRVKGKPFTPTIIGFYLAPQINALIRMGTKEDKLELCRALIGEINAEIVVAKIISIKGKQDRSKEPIVTRIVLNMQKQGRDTKKILVAETPLNAARSLTGLIAGQLASLYQKPTLLGKIDNDNNFVGSLRSLNKSSVENLKDFCEESGLFNWVAGHQAAAGFSLPVENIEKFIEYSEANLPPFEQYYSAWKIDGDRVAVIEQLVKLDAHYGPGFEPVLLYDEVYCTEQNTSLIGANANTLRILTDDLTYIKFRHKNGLPNLPTVLGVLGSPNENEFNNMISYQIIVSDYVENELEL